MSMSGDLSVFSEEELHALVRDRTVTPEAIVAEMEDAGCAPVAVADIACARKALDSLDPAEVDAICALPAVLRGLVVDEAISKKAGALVGALACSNDKAILKEAKRAIHILRTQGVKVEAPKNAPAAIVSAPAAPEELPCYMSNVDGFGERILLVARAAQRGVDVAQVVVSDVSGIVEARLAPLARKEYRKFVQGLSSTGSVLVGEVPRAYARGLITAALDLNARARKPVPTGFNEVSFALGPGNPPLPSPGRSLPVPENLAELASAALQLLQLDEMRTWMPAEHAVRPLAQKIEEVAASPLYLDDAQREATLKISVDEAVRAYWTPAMRALVSERLYDIAWLLQGAGRMPSAVLALASAHQLGSDRELEGVPFAWVLFEKLLPTLKARAGKQATPAP